MEATSGTIPNPRRADTLEILARCAKRFDWKFGDEGFEVVDTMPSRTGIVYRVRARPPAGQDIAMKVCADHWLPHHAKTAFELLVFVRRALAADSYLSVPEPLGWDAEVPSLCMSWVEGPSLQQVLRGNDSLSGVLSIPTELAGRCGRAYGLIHSATVRYGNGDPGSRRPAQKSYAAALRGLVTSRLAEKAAMRVLRGPGSAPHNIVVGEGGEITLVDSPRTHRMVSAPRALARFLVRAYADMAEAPSVPELPLRSRMAQFERAFLAGYAETGPCKFQSGSHAWLLTLHRLRLAIGLGKDYGLRRQWRQAFCLGAHAVRLGLRLALVGGAVPAED